MVAESMQYYVSNVLMFLLIIVSVYFRMFFPQKIGNFITSLVL